MTAWVNGVRSVNLDWTHDRPDAWELQGLCSQVDGDVWFPDKGHQNPEAKALCGRCPVQQTCLEAALERNDQWGIYGGLSLKERQKIRKERAAEDAA